MIKNHSLKLWLLMPVILILAFIADISFGSVFIPLKSVLNILLGNEEKTTWTNIIIHYRIPKALTGILAGTALGLSGLKMQSYFRNPLAGPFVLGISSGASLGVALLVMAGGLIGSSFISTNSWLAIAAASLGAGLVLLLVVLISLKIKDTVTILIIGLMVGSITGAVVGILQFFSSGEEIQIYLLWTFGSLGKLGWQELKIFGVVTLAGLVITLYLIKPLNAYLLGENYAKSLGISLKTSRLLIIIAASLFAGSSTAFCGPIAFIGIAVPHFARVVFNTSDHKILVPAVIFSGAITLLVCDLLSQLPGFEIILPLNAITSLVGAPVVIWVILKRKNLRYSF